MRTSVLARLWPQEARHLSTAEGRANLRELIGYAPGNDGEAGTWDSFDMRILHSDNSAVFDPETCFHGHELKVVSQHEVLVAPAC